MRIAVKNADKQDNEIHFLEEQIVQKDKQIAQLLNDQIEIADSSQLVDDSGGVDPVSPALSSKFDNLSFRDHKSDDED